MRPEISGDAKGRRLPYPPCRDLGLAHMDDPGEKSAGCEHHRPRADFLAALERHALHAAIARNARHRVVFTTSGYHLERETTANNFVVASGYFTPPHGVVIGTPSPGNPTFNTRGMLAGDVTLPLSVDGGGTKMVTINVLGRSKIQ